MIDVELIKSIIIYGLISGGMYALLAVGFSLIYGVTEVTNLAHGSLFMLGSYIFFFLATPYGGIELNLVLALILATIAVAIIGGILYRLIIDPAVKDPLMVMVITISLAIILEQAMSLTFGSYRQRVPSIGEALAKMLGTEDLVIVFGVKLTYSKILAFTLSLALFAILVIYISKTKTGRAMRALSQDREVAMLMGINTKRLSMLAMALSAAFAAVAGILITSSTGGVTYPQIWRTPLFMSFTIVVLGGLGSIKGSLVGAFIVGYIETIFSFWIDPLIASIMNVPTGATLSSAVVMATMLLVLLFRPKGLFGKRIELED